MVCINGDVLSSTVHCTGCNGHTAHHDSCQNGHYEVRLLLNALYSEGWYELATPLCRYHPIVCAHFELSSVDKQFYYINLLSSKLSKLYILFQETHPVCTVYVQ